MNFQRKFLSFSAWGHAPERLLKCAALLLLALPAAHLKAAPDFSMKGWATVGEATTGGAGGDVITVSKPEDLVDAIGRSEPLIIQIDGMIDLSESFPGDKSSGRYYVQSNKTIIGLGDDAGIRGGGFRMAEVSNVIIRNLIFRDAPSDSIVITHGSHHIWIDHNDLANGADGLVDITRASDFVTVSWNRFSDHDKTTLVGDTDDRTSDRGHLRVTYHNNWFIGTNQRHPRVRYGKVHVFNNFLDGINAGIGIGVEAQIFSENNLFESANTPVHYQDNSGQPGYMVDSGSNFGTDDLPSLRSSGVDWDPSDHYDYKLQSARDVKSIVTTYSGVGVIDGSNIPENPEPAPGEITSYSDWVEATYPNLDPSEALDPAGDPTGSGIPNLLRYAMGVSAEEATTGVPQEVGTQTDGGETYLTIEYDRLATAKDVDIIVEVSNDLQNWSELGADAIVDIDTNGDVETITVRDTVSLEDDEKRFMRLRAAFSS